MIRRRDARRATCGAYRGCPAVGSPTVDAGQTRSFVPREDGLNVSACWQAPGGSTQNGVFEEVNGKVLRESAPDFRRGFAVGRGEGGVAAVRFGQGGEGRRVRVAEKLVRCQWAAAIAQAAGFPRVITRSERRGRFHRCPLAGMARGRGRMARGAACRGGRFPGRGARLRRSAATLRGCIRDSGEDDPCDEDHRDQATEFLGASFQERSFFQNLLVPHSGPVVNFRSWRALNL